MNKKEDRSGKEEGRVRVSKKSGSNFPGSSLSRQDPGCDLESRPLGSTLNTQNE